MNEDIESKKGDLKSLEPKPKIEIREPINEEEALIEDGLILDDEESLSQFTNDSEVSLSSLESFETYESNIEPSEETNENAIDTIIDVFTVKRRKALIDTETDEDIVSAEVSEIRIFYGLLFICFFLCIICTILAFKYPTFEPQKTNPWDVQEKPQKVLDLPSVTFVYYDGTLNNFQMDGIYIANHSKTLKLPSGIFQTTIFTFLDEGNLFAIYSDGFKDIRFVNLNNFKHGIIMDRKLPPKHAQISTTVRVGHYFWIVGGFNVSRLDMDSGVRP